jgi:hypothetical protein
MSQEEANVTPTALKGFENMVKSEYRAIKYKIIRGLKVILSQEKIKKGELCI